MAGQAAPPSRIIPQLAEHNRLYWTGGADGRLVVPYCQSCARWILPPAPDCPDCEGALVGRAVSGQATVLTWTVNHHPFNPAVPPPYVIAIVELDEQPDLRMAANIVDCQPDSVSTGMAVQVRFEHHDVDPEPVFVPVFAPANPV
jgi:uncharacterized OB-fold protein